MTSFIDPLKEAAAVKSLRESLAAMGENDEELLLDTIEGQTSLFEIVDTILDRMAENAGMATGVAGSIQNLEARKTRFENRVKTDRAVLEQAMMIAELDKLERPAGTLSLVRRPAKVEITTESDIPAEFWKAGEPTLDKKALAAALKDGRPIPGAVLSNSAPSLTVRSV